MHNVNSVVSLTQYKNQRDNPIDAEIVSIGFFHIV